MADSVMIEDSTSKTSPIAVLGPECSYTDLACTKFLPLNPRIQKQSIKEVISSVATGATNFGLIPIENLINGMVSESIDYLRDYSNKIQIVNSTVLEINHYIGIPHGSAISLDQISHIYSHPQALEQSRDFIQNNCPQAILVHCNSTSEATLRLEDNKADIAVVASKEALCLKNAKLIGPTTKNYNATRFILIKSNESAINLTPSTVSSEKITSIIVHPGSDRKGLLLEMLSIISGEFEANLSAIHSRPDGLGGFVFYLELSLKDDSVLLQSLINSLREYCDKETGGKANINILGTYNKTPYFSPSITSIGIIGSKGSMGQWFTRFFCDLGISVIGVDIDSGKSEFQKLKNCSVIIFSLPMHNMQEATKFYRPFISNSSLVVENCSVKSESLNHLLNTYTDGNEVLGIHTMFGPSIETIKRENVIITRTEKSLDLSHEFEQLFYKAGAITHHGTIDNHDNSVSIVQALVQYSTIVLAQTLLSQVQNIEQLKPYLTPNSRLIFSNIERILKLSPELLFDIQEQNSLSKQLRHALGKSNEEVNHSLSSKENFIKLIEKLSQILAPQLNKLN